MYVSLACADARAHVGGMIRMYTLGPAKIYILRGTPETYAI